MTAIRTLRGLVAALAVALLVAIPTTAQSPAGLEAVKTVKLTGPANKRLDHMSLDAKRNRLYVANSGNNSVDVIDLKEGKVLKSIPGQEGVQGVVYVGDSDHLFAALGNGVCNVFDGNTFKELKSYKFPGADNPYYDAKSGLVYLTGADKKLLMIEAKSLNVKGEVQLPSAPASLVIEKGRPRMYVNAHVPRQVHVVDSVKHTVMSKYQLDEAGNYPLALDEANKRLFVGCRMEPRLVVLDTENGKQLASVPIPHDVDDIYLDAKRKQVYLSCGEPGYFLVIRETGPNKFEVVEKMQTAKQARTSLFDPESSRIFLATPGVGDKSPEVRVFHVK